MDDPCQRPFGGFVGENPDGVVLGLAHMDDGRQPRFTCRHQMVAETRLLGPVVTVHIVEIKPGLADTHYLGMAGQLQQPFRCGGLSLLVRLVGMNADAAPDVIVVLGDAAHTLKTVKPGGNGEHGSYPGMAGAGKHSFQVIPEPGKIEVTVAVHQEGRAHPSLPSSSFSST